MRVEIVSFGYGHSPAPEAHLVLDLRQHFRDPHVNPALRAMTAEDRAVRRAVLGTAGIRSLLRSTVRLVRAFDRGPSGEVRPGVTRGQLSCVRMFYQCAGW
ncbi:HEAT repeat domain-containing protein [Streptomyces coffeae]|uniref:ATPase n=1 Tax=Streptomyces coffeae TaxID=621382 RepID=A0ABS1NNW7_9ACTN|nr:ATPase [Streptomyces coffeae]MBL1101724.1 ATPase [Streptomyces coffeae]